VVLVGGIESWSINFSSRPDLTTRIVGTDRGPSKCSARRDFLQREARGRLEELTDGQGQRLVAYAYDAAGRLTGETRGNGTTTSYEYDAAGQLLHLVHPAPDATVLSRFDCTYDDNGRRVSVR
jgi:YD repeat-containing protein